MPLIHTPSPTVHDAIRAAARPAPLDKYPQGGWLIDTDHPDFLADESKKRAEQKSPAPSISPRAPQPAKPWITPPGELARRVLKRLGYEEQWDCGCQTFAAQMNRWGWMGCLLIHRRTIEAWFVVKARQHNITITDALIKQAIDAAIAEINPFGVKD